MLAVSAGPVVLHPRFTTAAQYSDNVFYQREGEDDFLFIFSPAINARLGRVDGPNQLNFNYRFDQVLYAQNDFANSTTHEFALISQYRGNRISHRSSHSFTTSDTVLPGFVGVIEDVIVDLESRNLERTYFNLGHTINYDLSERTGVYGSFDLSLRDYGGARQFDTSEWSPTVGFDYQVSPRVRMLGQVHYGQRSQDPNSDAQVKPPHSEFVGGSVGAHGQFTTKLSGRVTAGYEYRWFSDDEDAGGYPVVGMGLSYRFSERTSASLDYSRRGSVSSGVAKRATVVDSVSLQLRQTVGVRHPLHLSLGGRYAHNEADATGGAASLSTDYFSIDLGATYPIRQWLALAGAYSYEKRSGERDYDVNRVTLSVVLGY